MKDGIIFVAGIYGVGKAPCVKDLVSPLESPAIQLVT